MFLKFFLRLLFITVAFGYLLPNVAGVRMASDWVSLVIVSVLFNIFFAAMEWLLDVVVIGINISTLSIGLIFARFIEFASLLLAPSVAFYGCTKFLPQYCEIANYYPSAVVVGVTLGGVLFAQQVAANRK